MSGKEKLQNWIKSHDPELDWKWDNFKELQLQFEDTVSSSGNLDIVGLFNMMTDQSSTSSQGSMCIHKDVNTTS